MTMNADTGEEISRSKVAGDAVSAFAAISSGKSEERKKCKNLLHKPKLREEPKSDPFILISAVGGKLAVSAPN